MHLAQKLLSQSWHWNFASDPHAVDEQIFAAMSGHPSCIIDTCNARVVKKRRAAGIAYQIKCTYGDHYSDHEIENGVVCGKCYKALRDGRQQDEATAQNEDEHATPNHEISEETSVEYLENNLADISEAGKLRIIRLAAKIMSPRLRSFAESQRAESRSVESLAALTCGTFFASCPPSIAAFVNAIASHSADRFKVRAVEGLSQLVHKNFVSPFAFKQSTLITTLTQSKTVREIIASCLPAGGTDSIARLLRSASANEGPVLPGHIDIICTFDNQQILGRHHSLIPFRHNPISTCTAIMHMLCPESVLQLDPANELERFLGKGQSRTGSKDDLFRTTITSDDEKLIATSEMKNFFATMLPTVEKELKCDNEDYLQELGLLIDRVDFNRSCTKCWAPVQSKNQRFCKICKDMLPNSSEASQYLAEKATEIRARFSQGVDFSLPDPDFSHVPRGESMIYQMKNDDPTFALPNSYASCKAIVRELGKRLGIRRYGGLKHFAVLACDGQPYALLVNLIHNQILCSQCNSECWGTVSFERHKAQSGHHTAIPVFEFSWILLQMGYGHFEMNFMKMAIAAFWEPYFSEAMWILNFRTERAQDAAKKATDTHKAYELFNVMRYTFMMELITRFLSEKSNLKMPTFDNFLEFVTGNENENVANSWRFLRDVLQPLFIFRAGVRRNSSEYINLGLKLSLPLFFASSSRKYQGIILHHLITRALLPPKLSEFLRKTQSIGVRGQGLDFILEQQNRRAKKFLTYVTKPGDWVKVYRLLDHLDEVSSLFY